MLTADAPGTKTLTLATCDDTSADCPKKTVTFDFDFLDPDATRVLSFSPLSAFTSGLYSFIMHYIHVPRLED